MAYGNSFTVKMLEENQGRVVFSAPAGTGKTTACAEYISKHYQTEPCVFVSQTIKSLISMEHKLVELGVPRESIFNYFSGTKDTEGLTTEEIDTKCINSPIVLITHARLLFDSPYNYGKSYNGNRFSKKTIFIDESVNPIITVTFLLSQAEQWVDMAKIMLPQYESYSVIKEYNKYNLGLEDLIDTVSKLMSKRNPEGAIKAPAAYGFEISEGERSFNPCGIDAYTNDVQKIRRIENLYQCVAEQFIRWRYTNEKGIIKIVVPISIPETWYGKTENIQILDATGFLYQGFYKNFKQVQSDNWNWEKVHLYIQDTHKTEQGKIINSLSKTNLKTLPSSEIYQLFWKMPLYKYNRIYFVTFKGDYDLLEQIDETDSYFSEDNDNNQIMRLCVNYLRDEYSDYLLIDDEQYHEEDKIIHLSSYGRTRGSNAFRNCDCVVLFGDYRLNGHTMSNISSCYDGVTSDDIAVANFIQEIYRSRIRCDEPIDVYSINDTGLTTRIREMGIPFEYLDKSVYDEIDAIRTEELLIQKEESIQKFLSNPPTIYIQAILYNKDNLTLDNIKAFIAKQGKEFHMYNLKRDMERHKESLLKLVDLTELSHQIS